ncbi:putative salicylate hydroxylase [Rhexocercosporidium sp. MPI-PUGE-AT-0058]|nr:putative salicylate hydroxylase [Rhexocercosporidium sp. MPI-PUGE-AT-0058]
MIGEIEAKWGFRHCGASRAHFLDGLVGLIPKTVKVYFGKKAVDVVANDQDGKMRVRFDDGEEVIADAVVGCDGIRSACRRILLGPDEKSAKAVYSGKYAYRKVVDMKDAVKAVGAEVENRTIYSGRGGHLLMFPIRAGKALNIVVFKDADGEPWTQHQWVVRSSRAELLRDFEGWGEKPMKILELMENPDKWALFDHLPAPTYSKGNFCLLGDAAHATTPHSGAGAGFAIEDAHLLSGLLSPKNINSAEDIRYAFRAYDEVRRPRSQELVTRSRKQGMMLDLQQSDGGVVTGEELKSGMEQNMDWVWEIDLSEMLERGKGLSKSYPRS